MGKGTDPFPHPVDLRRGPTERSAGPHFALGSVSGRKGAPRSKGAKPTRLPEGAGGLPAISALWARRRLPAKRQCRCSLADSPAPRDFTFPKTALHLVKLQALHPAYLDLKYPFPVSYTAGIPFPTYVFWPCGACETVPPCRSKQPGSSPLPCMRDGGIGTRAHGGAIRTQDVAAATKAKRMGRGGE